MLTPEEEKDFNEIDLLAYDLIKEKYKKNNQIAPPWLTFTKKERERARQELHLHLSNHPIGKMRGVRYLTEQYRLSDPEFLSRIEKWKQAELIAKEGKIK